MATRTVHSGFAAFGGAVPTLAIARTNHARKMGQICPNPSQRFVQLLHCLRSSRLCVLMNPCPAGLEIHPDLASYRTPPIRKGAFITLRISSCTPDNSGKCSRINLSISVRAQLAQDPQFTNRRMRTFIATPSDRNVNNTEDPP